METIPGPHRPELAVSRIPCSNVRGLAGNLSDLTVASSQYDILLCSETLDSDMRHVLEVLVPGFCRPVLLCRGKMPRHTDLDMSYKLMSYMSPRCKITVVTLVNNCKRYCYL